MLTAQDIAYARLAERAYTDIRSEKNRPLVPTGWEDVSDQYGVGAQPAIDGFSARVFKSGDALVIAYEGTNGTNPFTNPDAWQDWMAGNLSAFLGISSSQVRSAALLYLKVAQHNPEKVSLTGHSLGGGLASIMAAVFDRQGTTFALVRRSTTVARELGSAGNALLTRLADTREYAAMRARSYFAETLFGLRASSLSFEKRFPSCCLRLRRERTTPRLLDGHCALERPGSPTRAST